MKVQDAVVFVTGANRGLGLEFARQALARGARKVYAGARDPASVTLEGVIPVKLDVTNPADVAAAVAAAGDVTLLINNAGIARTGGLFQDGAAALLQEQLNTNVFGILSMAQAFASTLARNGGGAMLNVLSVASWINTPLLATYGITKSAAWALTNGLRHELREQGTQVVGLHAGFIDTDLTRGFEVAKSSPKAIVDKAYETLESDGLEVVSDEKSALVKEGLSHGVYLQEVSVA